VPKKRIYQVAKEFRISSEALIGMLNKLGYDFTSHMNAIEDEAVEKVRAQFEKEKEAVKREYAKKVKKAVRERRKTPAKAGKKGKAAPAKTEGKAKPTVKPKGTAKAPAKAEPAAKRKGLPWPTSMSVGTQLSRRSAPSTSPVSRSHW